MKYCVQFLYFTSFGELSQLLNERKMFYVFTGLVVTRGADYDFLLVKSIVVLFLEIV